MKLEDLRTPIYVKKIDEHEGVANRKIILGVHLNKDYDSLSYITGDFGEIMKIERIFPTKEFLIWDKEIYEKYKNFEWPRTKKLEALDHNALTSEEKIAHRICCDAYENGGKYILGSVSDIENLLLKNPREFEPSLIENNFLLFGEYLLDDKNGGRVYSLIGNSKRKDLFGVNYGKIIKIEPLIK